MHLKLFFTDDSDPTMRCITSWKQNFILIIIYYIIYIIKIEIMIWSYFKARTPGISIMKANFNVKLSVIGDRATDHSCTPRHCLCIPPPFPAMRKLFYFNLSSIIIKKWVLILIKILNQRPGQRKSRYSNYSVKYIPSEKQKRAFDAFGRMIFEGTRA